LEFLLALLPLLGDDVVDVVDWTPEVDPLVEVEPVVAILLKFPESSDKVAMRCSTAAYKGVPDSVFAKRV